MEMLIRTAGRRATDTYQWFLIRRVRDDGVEKRLFLASGIRHIEGAPETVGQLRHGQRVSAS